MRFPFSLKTLIAFLAIINLLNAQSQNLLQNPGFERSMRTANPWSGISSSGLISAPPSDDVKVLGASGEISQQTMPPSVSACDLNGDGLQDIAIMDGQNYLRVHFNTGTKQQPKFGLAEFASLFPNPAPLMLEAAEDDDAKKKAASPPKPTPLPAASKPGVEPPPVYTWQQVIGIRSVPRLHLADISRTGKLDLLIGNYGGDVLLIQNSGSTSRPDFRNPTTYESALLQKGFERWGNVFAPYAVDWDKDNKMDLLIGEASYSANSLHIFPGKGIGKPSLEPDDRSVLAYGMGLEQLTPCVVDYNGDGNNDVLVAERGGKIAVYLGKGGPFKPNESLAFNSFITLDGAPPNLPATAPKPEPGASVTPLDAINATNLLSAGGACTISAGDFNGDGLFDLIFGKRSGRVGLSLNEGTATQPKFKAPIDIKAEETEKPMLLPSSWTADYGLKRGNFGGYITVVKNDAAAPASPPAQPPPEGISYLEAGYLKLDYKFFPQPTFPKTTEQDSRLIWAPNVYSLFQELSKPLKVGKTHVLSFKVKGAQLSNGRVNIFYRGSKKTGTGEIISRGERGSVTRDNQFLLEDKLESINFSAGSNWVEVKKEFTVKFDKKELADLTETSNKVIVRALFELTPGSGIVQFDDFNLVEK